MVIWGDCCVSSHVAVLQSLQRSDKFPALYVKEEKGATPRENLSSRDLTSYIICSIEMANKMVLTFPWTQYIICGRDIDSHAVELLSHPDG